MADLGYRACKSMNEATVDACGCLTCGEVATLPTDDVRARSASTRFKVSCLGVTSLT